MTQQMKMIRDIEIRMKEFLPGGVKDDVSISFLIMQHKREILDRYCD